MPDKGTQFPEIIDVNELEDTQIPNYGMNPQLVVEDSVDSDESDDYAGWIAKHFNDVSHRWRGKHSREDVKANWNRIYTEVSSKRVNRYVESRNSEDNNIDSHVVASPCTYPPLMDDSQDIVEEPTNDPVVSSPCVHPLLIDDSQDIKVQTPHYETYEETGLTIEEIEELRLKLKNYHGEI